MNILYFLTVGLIAGWLASYVIRGHGLGIVGDIAVGIVGALVGGFIFNSTGTTTYGIAGAIGLSAIGAIVFLIFVRLITGNRQIGATKL